MHGVSHSTPNSHSVIIPTYQRPDLLERCLSALDDAQPAPWSWDVLVVDNSPRGDRRANEAVVQSFQRPEFRYSSMEPRGLTAARHQGIVSTKGDVVSFLDDDSFVSNTWLMGIRRAFIESGATVVGGPCIPEYESPPPGWLDSFWGTSDGVRYLTYVSLLDAGDRQREISATHVYGCNLSVTRAALLETRGFNPDSMPAESMRFQGDGETALSVKLEAAGHKTLYDPSCGIRHFVPSSRMTEQYFEARAFSFGIEGSFTALRAEHGLTQRDGVPSKPPASVFGTIKGTLWRIRRGMRRLVGTGGRHGVTEPENSEMHERLQGCYEAGWSFHRDAVAEDPALVEYLLQPEYWDPSVWEACCADAPDAGANG